MRLVFLCFLIIGSGALTTAAQQQDSLFSIRSENSTVAAFVQQLETLTPYTFFYDSAQVDSFRVTVALEKQSLKTILDAAFKGTDLQYALDDQHHVFITRALQVLTTLTS